MNFVSLLLLVYQLIKRRLTPMLRHYVEYLYPGICVSETSTREVAERNAALIAIPDRSFGFRFFSREEVELDGEVLVGKPKDYSNWIYEGEELTLAQVKKRYPDKDTLISNMECNGYDRVVMTRFGQAMLLEEGDKVRS